MADFPWKAVALGGAALGIGYLVVSRAKPTPIAAATPRVALIGDSYAVGLGPKLAQLIPDFRFEGHVGTNTGQWARHAAQCGECGDWLTAFKPAIVLVSLGVNDGSAPKPGDYNAIVSALHGIGAKIVWLEPPARVGTPARSVIASLGVPVIAGTDTPLSADGLHPASYTSWAQEIARAIG